MECEVCGDPIVKPQVTVHYFDTDGEHLMHFACHDQFMQERGTGITDVYIYQEGHNA